jgi:predicted RNA methylase
MSLSSVLSNHLPPSLAYFKKRVAQRARTARRWFRDEGFKGVVLHGVHYLLSLRNLKQRDLEFDKGLGVDTRGPVGLWRLRVPFDNLRHAARYEGSDPNLLRELLRDLQQDFSTFSFVDLGCGKGRALLVAGEFGFAQLIGIEFAAQLAETAARNCCRLGLPAKIVNQDASQFQFPTGNLVAYLYNPFGALVLRPVLDRLLATQTAECFLIYVNPLHRRLIDDCPRMHQLAANRGSAVWRLSPRSTVVDAADPEATL